MPLYRNPRTGELLTSATPYSAHPRSTRAGLTPRSHPRRVYVVGLEHVSTVPYSAQVIARFREAFAAIATVRFEWNAMHADAMVRYRTDSQPDAESAQLLGATGFVFVDTIMRRKVWISPQECEPAFRDKASVLANTGIHELGHLLGLISHSAVPENYMFSPENLPIPANSLALRERLRLQEGHKHFTLQQLEIMRRFIADDMLKPKQRGIIEF